MADDPTPDPAPDPTPDPTPAPDPVADPVIPANNFWTRSLRDGWTSRSKSWISLSRAFSLMPIRENGWYRVGGR